MDRTVNRVHSLALVFSWILAVLHTITKVILWIISFFLFKNMIQGDGISLLVQSLGSCYSDKEGSCYEKFMATFGKAAQPYAWVVVKVDTIDVGAKRILDLGFYVYLNNPVSLLVGTVATAIVCWLLGYVYDFLTDVADITTVPDPK